MLRMFIWSQNKAKQIAQRRDKRGFMNISDYEYEFIDELIDNYEGGSWKDHVRKCHEIYMDSKDEKRIEKLEIEQL